MAINLCFWKSIQVLLLTLEVWGLDPASQKEGWSGWEEVCFLLSSVPELKYLTPKLKI